MTGYCARHGKLSLPGFDLPCRRSDRGAHRLATGLGSVLGYLAAGILIGPYTPGFVADAGLSAQLAEVGVILLMFGVGLHFSLKDLLSVAKMA